MVSALDRFRGYERDAAISQTERARNVQNRFLSDLTRSTSSIAPLTAPTPPPGSVGSTVVDAVDRGDRDSRTVSTKFNYPAELPAITPEVEAAYQLRRRDLTRGVEDAAAYRQAGTQTGTAKRDSASAELTRQLMQAGNETLASYAAAGRAFSPMGVAETRARLAGDTARRQVMLEEDLAGTVQELNRMFRVAERGAEAGRTAIEFERGTARSRAAVENTRARENIDRLNQQMGF